jgi:hypothetical protein
MSTIYFGHSVESFSCISRSQLDFALSHCHPACFISVADPPLNANVVDLSSPTPVPEEPRSSFRRTPESRFFKGVWTAAFAGVTLWRSEVSLKSAALPIDGGYGNVLLALPEHSWVRDPNRNHPHSRKDPAESDSKIQRALRQYGGFRVFTESLTHTIIYATSRQFMDSHKTETSKSV